MKNLLIALPLLLATVTFGADFVIYANSIVTGNGGSEPPGCPGHYAGYAVFTKTIAQGWGWKTNGVSHSASVTNRSDVKVLYIGKNGDKDCGTNTISLPPNPTGSSVYRFTIYYTNSVPTGTNQCPLLLSGFDP